MPTKKKKFQNPALSRPKSDSIDYNAKNRISLALIMTEKNENEIPQLKVFRRAVLLESVSVLGPPSPKRLLFTIIYSKVGSEILTQCAEIILEHFRQKKQKLKIFGFFAGDGPLKWKSLLFITESIKVIYYVSCCFFIVPSLVLYIVYHKYHYKER